MHPPLDNADPVTDHNEALKYGLRLVAVDDWERNFPMLGHPSDDYVRRVAADALKRIEELERDSS